MDFVIEGVEEYIGVTIISSRHEKIRIMIIDKLGKGVTIYQEKRVLENREKIRILPILSIVSLHD